MSLSDRLAAAAKAREQRSRAEPGEAAGIPSNQRVRRSTATSAATATAERVQLILAPSHPAVAITPDPAAAPDAVCPTCGRTGELGLVDLARRTADWSCVVCGTMWRALMPAPADGELPPPSR